MYTNAGFGVGAMLVDTNGNCVIEAPAGEIVWACLDGVGFGL